MRSGGVVRTECHGDHSRFSCEPCTCADCEQISALAHAQTVSRSQLCFFSSDSGMQPPHPPIQWAPGLKRSAREADHSPPASTEIKKTWVYMSTPPICRHGRGAVKNLTVGSVVARMDRGDTQILLRTTDACRTCENNLHHTFCLRGVEQLCACQRFDD
jgi:hypothetical protein